MEVDDRTPTQKRLDALAVEVGAGDAPAIRATLGWLEMEADTEAVRALCALLGPVLHRAMEHVNLLESELDAAYEGM